MCLLTVRIDGSYTRRGRGMESRGHGKGNQHWMDWLTRCDAIAASDLFSQKGHPEVQVTLLKATLLRAAAEGVNWREIYRSLYDRWHTECPHFPDFNTMTDEIDESSSRLRGTESRSSLPERS